jgi:hypothetical protein
MTNYIDDYDLTEYIKLLKDSDIFIPFHKFRKMETVDLLSLIDLEENKE